MQHDVGHALGSALHSHDELIHHVDDRDGARRGCLVPRVRHLVDDARVDFMANAGEDGLRACRNHSGESFVVERGEIGL